MNLFNLAVGKVVKPLNLWDVPTVLFFQKLRGFIKR